MKEILDFILSGGMFVLTFKGTFCLCLIILCWRSVELVKAFSGLISAGKRTNTKAVDLNGKVTKAISQRRGRQKKNAE